MSDYSQELLMMVKKLRKQGTSYMSIGKKLMISEVDVAEMVNVLRSRERKAEGIKDVNKRPKKIKLPTDRGSLSEFEIDILYKGQRYDGWGKGQVS
jgi:biotin operon repressor